jgi:hypothetical protein
MMGALQHTFETGESLVAKAIRGPFGIVAQRPCTQFVRNVIGDPMKSHRTVPQLRSLAVRRSEIELRGTLPHTEAVLALFIAALMS